MTGRWAAAIAARLLREETYRLMVAPAIADLQFEPSARWRHYAAVWWVISQAVLHDVRLDLSAVFGPAAQRGVWPQILGLYILFFIVRAVSRATEGIRVHTPDMPAGTYASVPLPPIGDGLEPYLAGVLISAALSCAAYAALPAVFMFCRRHISTRSIVVGVVCLAAITYGTVRLARPAMVGSRLYQEAAVRRGTTDPKVARPLAQVIAENVIRPTRERGCDSDATRTPSSRHGPRRRSP